MHRSRRWWGLVPAMVLAIVAGAHGAAGPAEAQDVPSSGTAALTFLNPASDPVAAQLEFLPSGNPAVALRQVVVPALGARTIDLATDHAPAQFRASCSGCRAFTFAAASGQRLILELRRSTDPAPIRSDLYLSNESGRALSGAIRTGGTLGRGRTLARFTLAPGEARQVGIRASAGRQVLLHVDRGSGGAIPILIGNGVDLTIPLN